jgi:hypothetical protein
MSLRRGNLLSLVKFFSDFLWIGLRLEGINPKALDIKGFPGKPPPLEAGAW